MAFSMRCRFLPLFFSLISLSWAGTVTYDFEIGWVTANPDGQADRPVIGINGQWPLPVIEVTVGDRLIINVLNSLGNQSTSLHFHGLFMENSTHMDGPPQVTQCEIPSGSRFTYDFEVRTDCYKCCCYLHILTITRYNNQALIGTIHMHEASTPMVYALHSLSTTPTTPTRTSTMKRWSYRSPTGTTTRCLA